MIDYSFPKSAAKVVWQTAKTCQYIEKNALFFCGKCIFLGIEETFSEKESTFFRKVILTNRTFCHEELMRSSLGILSVVGRWNKARYKREERDGNLNNRTKHKKEALLRAPLYTLLYILRIFCLQLTELSVNSSHVSDEVENLVRVTDLIVIPANNLNEGVSQSDTSLSIEDRSASVTQEVS